ncbi:STAS/SEC14 domain-containing protein [Yoonia sp.]|uniref:STAS/SEC14 domain-containing protein n=1 Tax=Yoonia sp. TaxID=2212373 RepID=UPI002FDA9D09
MLYRITSFAMPSLGAIGVEMARLPKLFGLLGKYDRCAVLTDIPWLRTAAEMEGALIPGLEIKAFALDAVDDAESWLIA